MAHDFNWPKTYVAIEGQNSGEQATIWVSLLVVHQTFPFNDANFYDCLGVTQKILVGQRKQGRLGFNSTGEVKKTLFWGLNCLICGRLGVRNSRSSRGFTKNVNQCFYFCVNSCISSNYFQKTNRLTV